MQVKAPPNNIINLSGPGGQREQFRQVRSKVQIIIPPKKYDLQTAIHDDGYPGASPNRGTQDIDHNAPTARW